MENRKEQKNRHPTLTAKKKKNVYKKRKKVTQMSIKSNS